MKKRRGRTRVSGHLDERNGNDFNVSHKKILFIGQKKTYETTTDETGFYELYDLPPGQYQLKPEIQKGWRIDRMWLRWVADLDEVQNSTRSLTFTLKPKRHASINVSFEPDNAVEGSIVDQLGKPIEKVCVYLWSTDQSEGFGPYDCTDAKGEFRIESISEGSYVLVVNAHGATSGHNFPRRLTVFR